MYKIIIIGLFAALLFFSGLAYVFAQDETSGSSEVVPSSEKSVEGKIDAVFPEENKNIIFIEGERAVATNFFQEPIKNFGCSGKRTLQLSRATGLQGGAAFYADFLFYVEEAGIFEFWYGGTPAGPQEEDLESYSSPFRYIIDDGNAIDVSRRKIAVVEQYTPSYYWNLVGDVNLAVGKHKIRFEVKDRRRYDGRFYFYLDCFFFVRKAGRSRVTGTPIPEVFPKNMDDRSINKPFLAIEEYLKKINQKPNDIKPYIEVSLVFSLLSDYLSALKYLKKAQVIDPKNLEVLLLIAKNTIWDGDVEEGLKRYKELLALEPKRYEIWMEAGKVAAWTGRYRDAIAFFEQGLKYYPDDLGLQLNWGITLEWAGEVRDAEGIYNRVFENAKNDRLLLKKLAIEYEVNGYPMRALAVYAHLQNQFPQYLEYYISQQELYSISGKIEEAGVVGGKIRERFKESEKLNTYLIIQKEKQGLRDALFQEYRKELERSPDNLDLREMLAQTLFWNGLSREAVKEYLNILTNHTYREIKLADSRAFSLLETLDKLYILYTYFNNIPNVAANKKKEADDQMAVLRRTQVLQESVVKQLQALEQKIAGLQANLTGDEAADAKVKAAIAKEEENKKELENERDKLGQKMFEDKKLIGEKVKEGYSYYERYSEAVAALKELTARIETIKAAEYGENETFKKVKETTTWEWNKAFVLTELRELEAQKLFLAEHIIAKIAQAEKRPADAEPQLKDNIESTPTLPPESKYLYLETLIWQGKGKDALAFMEKELGVISEYAPHAPLVKDFLLKYAAVGQYMGQISDDYEKELQALAGKFSGIISEAGKNKQVVNESAAVLLDLYYQRLVRTFFYNQQNTYLLRNELGKFYLEEENLNAAIRQFEQVLAMDPNDMAAIYQLGLVYRWKGDWSSAMDYFKRVYDRDPNYERSAAFYNDLARQNSDLVTYGFNYIIDTAIMEGEGTANIRGSELDYTHPINTMWAFKAGYGNEYYRYYKEWIPDPVKPYTYNYHDLKLGVSFYYIDWGLRITPYVGLRVLLSDDFYIDTRDETFPDDPAAIFKYFELEPYAYIEASLWEQGIFTTSFAGGYERYHETYAYFLDNVYEVWGELNMVFKFSFVDFPVIKGTQLRVYGKGEFLDDGNIIYETAGYLDIRFMDLEYPDIDATLYAQVWYQDSVEEKTGISDYFDPQGKFQAFGGLGVTAYLAVTQEQVLGLSLKVQGGPYYENFMQEGSLGSYIKIEGDFTIEYVINTLRFYLETNYQGTYYEDGVFSNIYYFQLSIKLGLEARFPSLLAQ